MLRHAAMVSFPAKLDTMGPLEVTTMFGDGSWHEFATVLDIQPAGQAAQFERHLRSARPETGMKVEVRGPGLAFFVVEADMEYLAIERATRWLNGIAEQVQPPIRLNVNPQPSHEV